MTIDELKAAVQRCGSIRAAGRELQIPESNLRLWLRRGGIPEGKGLTREQVAEVKQEKAATVRVKDLEKELAIEKEKVRLLRPDTNKIVNTTRLSTITFGLISDLHYGNEWHNRPAVEAFYKEAYACGVRKFYCAGDVLEGNRVFKGQEFELMDVGLEAQLDRFEEWAPHYGETFFITGNHDQSFKYQVGVNVGKMIESRRKDWHFLGEEHALVQWDTPKGPFKMRLLHPGGGSSYALSYKSQKIVDGMTDPRDLLVLGHFHKADHLPWYKETAVIQAGTGCDQTPFMARQGLAAHVGGWIVEVGVREGRCASIKAEFIGFNEQTR